MRIMVIISKYITPMKKILLTTIAVSLGVFSAAQAAITQYQPSPVDLNDLDHHDVYTWRIDGINLSSVSITSATLTIRNIANWDTNPNILYIHLLDTAINAGVASFVDDPSGSAPVTDLTDDFVSTRYHSSPGWLVANGTRDTLLASPSFTTTGHDYTLNFTAAELVALNSYINSGHDVAFGFDPDCHFFNDGISFTITTSPIPEFSSGIPVAGLVGVAVAIEMFRRRRGKRLI